MITQFGIHIKVKNMDKSLKFYLNFGLKPVFAYGQAPFLKKLGNIPTAPEKYRGVIFGIGEALFEIAENHIAVKKKVFKEIIRSSKISAMLYVPSVTKVVAICKKNAYEIVVEPRVFPWGTKEVVVRDPDGFILVFIEKIK